MHTTQQTEIYQGKVVYKRQKLSKVMLGYSHLPMEWNGVLTVQGED